MIDPLELVAQYAAMASLILLGVAFIWGVVLPFAFGSLCRKRKQYGEGNDDGS
jgi:hypothetical protein